MRSLMLVICALVMTGCAGKIGEDKSEDVRAENTTLKVRVAQLELDKRQATDRAESVGKALDACYGGKK